MSKKLTRFEVPGNPVAYSVIEHVLEAISTSKSRVRILEVGSFRGASAVTFSRFSGNFLDFQLVCCDAWGKIGTKEHLNYQHFFSVLDRFGVGGEVIEIVGFSSKTLRLLTEESFDVVYIDGCHGMTQVLDDLQCAKRLIKPGGVIFGDDYDCSPGFASDLDSVELEADHHWVGPYGCHPGVVIAVEKIFGRPTKTFGSVWGFLYTEDNFFEIDFRGRHFAPSDLLDDELLRSFFDHSSTESGLPSNHPFVADL